MKRIKGILKHIFALATAFVAMNSSYALAQDSNYSSDSIVISLLTCSPHDEVYSLYGHTAIRVNNMYTGQDWVFNYGVFSFNKPFFALRFAIGLTDYELGVVPYEIFKREYRRFGSQVTEQVINLSLEDKMQLIMALDNNYRPENRVYRYNFFYSNCTTRARDIIERNISGKIEYPKDSDRDMTMREMVSQCTAGHPWATFGNDLCLGFLADIKTSSRQQQFLPLNLMADFSRAQIYEAGSYKPMVAQQNIVVMPGVQFIEDEFPLRPMHCFAILTSIIVALTAIGTYKGRLLRGIDFILFGLAGLAGIFMTIVFFSLHPTTSSNLQILLLTPLHLATAVLAIRGKAGIKTWWTATISIVLFLLGGTIQNYAEGITLLAIAMLLRSTVNLRFAYNRKNGLKK